MAAELEQTKEALAQMQEQMALAVQSNQAWQQKSEADRQAMEKLHIECDGLRAGSAAQSAVSLELDQTTAMLTSTQTELAAAVENNKMWQEYGQTLDTQRAELATQYTQLQSEVALRDAALQELQGNAGSLGGESTDVITEAVVVALGAMQTHVVEQHQVWATKYAAEKAIWQDAREAVAGLEVEVAHGAGLQQQLNELQEAFEQKVASLTLFIPQTIRTWSCRLLGSSRSHVSWLVYRELPAIIQHSSCMSKSRYVALYQLLTTKSTKYGPWH